MRAPASGVSCGVLPGCRERRQGRPSRPPTVRVQAAKGSSSSTGSANGKGGGSHHGGGTGGVPPAAVGHSVAESATAAAAAAPQTAAAQTDELLRMVDLLEKREQERQEDHKHLLTLLKAVTAVGATPAPPSDLQRLERAYSRDVPATPVQPPLSSTTTECTIQHPGVLCCTRTSISVDESSKQVVLTLRTQVNPSGNGDANAGVSTPEFVALGAQALCIAANDLSCTRTAAASALSAESTATHAELVSILQQGRVVDSQPLEGGHETHPSFKVLLEHRGKKSWAIFKPRIDGDGDGWHRATMEWVAYELSLMLGLDLVPPVAYRRGGVECHYQHFEEGAFIHFVPDAVELQEAPLGAWGVPQALLLSDTRILDVLLHNSDRHHGHFLFGPGWVAPHGKQPILIDHAAAFRKEAHVTLDHENAFRTGPVRCVSSRTYLRLRFLDARSIAARFAGTLSTGEMRALLTRRNAVLERLDALVEVQGFAATVIEPSAPLR